MPIHLGRGGVGVAALDGLKDRTVIAVDPLCELGAESLPGHVGLEDREDRLRRDP